MTDEQYDKEFEERYYRELQEQREKLKIQHRDMFWVWLAKQAGSIKTIPEAHGFKVGDRVTFTNDNGVVFPGHTILAIDSDDSFYGRQFYLDYDCYWFPAHPKNLTKEN